LHLYLKYNLKIQVVSIFATITMDAPEYIVIEGLPTPQVYHDLRKLAGMTPPPMDAVPKALANSFVGILAYERRHMTNDTTPGPGQEPVAMGRLLGDCSLFLLLCDVAVHPEHQRRGLGKRILQALVDYVDKHAPEAYVSLVAEPQAQKLYPLFGFKRVDPSVGMFRMIRDRKLQGESEQKSVS
jgi:ribosomal protein S18 acetylase RimI-like enzyme